MKTRTIRTVFAAAAAAMVALAALVASTGLARAAISASWSDDFDSPALSSRWSWIREDPARWNLTSEPGLLRITTQQGSLRSFSARNILIQDVSAGDYQIETHVTFTPTENIQTAGLIAYQDDGSYVALLRAYCGFVPACAGNAIYFDHVEQGEFIGGNFAMPTAAPGEAYLRLVRHGSAFSGYFSADGIAWVPMGTHTYFGPSPTRVGLHALNNDFGAAEIPADFDYFRIESPLYRVALPLQMRH